MSLTRRDFFIRGGAATAAALLLSQTNWAQDAPRYRLSACDWSARAGGAEGLQAAKTIGLDGLEVSAGGPADVLELADPARIAAYKGQMAATGVVVSSTAMGLLNGNPFATEPRAPQWLEQTIGATRDLGAKVILLAFFGQGDLRDGDKLKAGDVDATVERIKAAAPKAQEAGVILGIENTLSAKDNLDILERIGHDSVRVYYDIGNSTNNGYDVPAEIRMLGDRICQIHFKDGGNYLGEGEVDVPAAVAAINDSGYRGWIVLETSIPSKDRDADFKRNAAYVRELMGMA